MVELVIGVGDASEPGEQQQDTEFDNAVASLLDWPLWQLGTMEDATACAWALLLC